MAADILKAKELDTALRRKLPASQLEVATADIRTTNGVIHVLDAVLLPRQN